jgi:hypothetical protein
MFRATGGGRVPSDDSAEFDEGPGRTPVLSIGALFGGTHDVDRRWQEPIRALRRRIRSASADVDGALRVNVVYHVEGKYLPLEFDGVRTAKFRKSDSLLMVQAAVPMKTTENEQEVLLRLLRAAIEAAEQYAQANGAASDLIAVRQIVRGLG